MAKTEGKFNLTQCSIVQDHYTDRFYRATQFAAYMNTEWETCQSTNSQCLLDFNDSLNPLAFSPPRSCEQGSIPSHYIDVRCVEDIQAGLKFSRAFGVPLVIKNTGHDYKGRSSAPNSLALWMHNLKEISFTMNFVAEGCSKHLVTPAVTFAAGTSQGELYKFAEKMNISLPGGADATVGAAGGYVQGGGHSAFANVYGLAADRVLEFDVVTPGGALMKANACSNTDLFFALRGGGGGTFGVVLQVTMKAHPPISFPVVNITVSQSDRNQRKLLSFLIDNSLAFAEAGWGGYINPRQSVIYVNPLMNLSQAQTAMAPLRDLVINELQGTFLLVVEPSITVFFDKYLNHTGVPVGLPFMTTSRLIPADNFRSPWNRELLLETLIPVMDNAALPLIFAVTPYLFKDDGGTSTTDAWRSSLWHVTASKFWNFDSSSAERKNIYHNMSQSMDRLRKITPDSGAYLNEADVLEPNPAEAYWGHHYDRLASIKKKYDPHHILDCWQCVGWKGRSDGRYGCYV